MADPHWQSGDAILLRSIPAEGRVGTVLPVTVVRDDPNLVALYLAPGTTCKRRLGKRGGRGGRTMLEDSGQHEEWVWGGNRRLFLWRPPEMWAVSLFWDASGGAFRDWYIDVLEAFRRTSLGFDTRDLDLDVVVAPDRTWRWKDEDELAWAAEQGRLGRHTTASIRAAAERAIALLEADDPLFSDQWVSWQPDPFWPIPGIPGGWNIV